MQNTWDRTYIFVEDSLSDSLEMDWVLSLPRGMAQLIAETQTAAVCHTAVPQPPMPAFPRQPSRSLPVLAITQRDWRQRGGDSLVVNISFSQVSLKLLPRSRGTQAKQQSSSRIS